MGRRLRLWWYLVLEPSHWMSCPQWATPVSGVCSFTVYKLAPNMAEWVISSKSDQPSPAESDDLDGEALTLTGRQTLTLTGRPCG